MKIGLVCPYNMFKGGGVQECVLAMQSELTARGHEASIITPKPLDFKSSTPKDMILVGAAKDVKSPFHTTAQLSVSLDPIALQEMLDKEQFDVLHFHEPWVPVVSRQILTKSHAANVATFHAKLPDSIMSRTIEKVITPYTASIMKYLDEFAAVSEAAAEYVSTIDERSPVIIPNGIDLAKYTFVERDHKIDAPMILFIGRLEKRKGIKYLLKAFAVLQKDHPNLRLVIGGDGTDRQKLEQFVQDNQIHNVEFKGFLSEQQKLDLLAEASVFCSPALYGESFGIVLLEAMARGCVVVAGDNPGYSSVLDGKGKLSLINPKNITEFARRLEVMLTDKEVRDMWLSWSREYVKQFNYVAIVDQYEQMYTRVLKNKKKQT